VPQQPAASLAVLARSIVIDLLAKVIDMVQMRLAGMLQKPCRPRGSFLFLDRLTTDKLASPVHHAVQCAPFQHQHAPLLICLFY
jgi:hypothetical protein